MKKITKILALMLVLTMGACMFTGCSAESEVQGVVEDYLDAVFDGDLEDAIELVNDGELKDAMTETHKRIQKDSEYKEEYLDDVEGIEYEIKDVKVDGKEAEVEIELTDDDDSRTMHLKLKKIDGDWLIVGGRV